MLGDFVNATCYRYLLLCIDCQIRVVSFPERVGVSEINLAITVEFITIIILVIIFLYLLLIVAYRLVGLSGYLP